MMRLSLNIIFLFFSVLGMVAQAAPHSSGPLDYKDCVTALTDPNMAVAPTYQCSSCDSMNAMNPTGVTQCWKCEKPHTTEAYRPSFTRESGGVMYGRPVDVYPRTNALASRVQCPHCQASQPGIDPATGAAPTACLNSACGRPLAREEGGLVRLIFIKGQPHLIAVDGALAEQLDQVKNVENTAERLRAALRQEYLTRHGSDRISVEEIDRAILRSMVGYLSENMGAVVDVDEVIRLKKGELQRAQSEDGAGTKGAVAANGPTSFEASPARVSPGGILSKTLQQIVDHKRQVLGALAALGLGVGSFGFDNTYWDGEVTSVSGNEVSIAIQVSDAKTIQKTFRISLGPDSRMETGDNVTVHGPRWFGGYQGLGAEDGGAYKLGR